MYMNNGISTTIVSVLGGIALLISNASLALQSKATSTVATQAEQVQAMNKQRVDSAPYSSNRVKRNSKKMSVLKDRTRVRFKVKFKRGLGIANSDVKWSVRPVSGKGTQLKRGREATMRLKPGKYVVSLRIGDFKKTQNVTVKRSRNSVQTIPVSAKIGIVKASSNFANVASSDVKWTITNSKGTVVSRTSGKDLKRIVQAGSYKVAATYKGNKKGRNVTVANGRVGKTTIHMPTGSVKFRAFKGNGTKQPLMEKAAWTIYDARGKSVSASSKNNFRVTLFPGKYSVVVKTRGKKQKKTFNIQSGRNSDVVLHL
ncbi:MAG: Unknown protein [uncultured Thiotrichaceae bacterium]|uniref:Uncharacterized protein n=1 Tax=uncultured Thiotrichaceae bacterium TaxID=298394 RepID=A0A6S6TSJ8_9GAMM|nr:MAG: Unknown protein [uncultured Thiotrichaceae bacterium]